MSKSLDSYQARHNVGPDLDPNYLQKLSADDTRWQRTKINVAISLMSMKQYTDNIFGLENVVCFLCLLHYIQVHLRLDFIMEANTMNPDQTAPENMLIWDCTIGYQRTKAEKIFACLELKSQVRLLLS